MLWSRGFTRNATKTLRQLLRSRYRAASAPSVNANGCVTFRLWSADASEVTLILAGVRKAMKRDLDNLWSYTTAPLTPGVYAYSFLIHGVSISGPSNCFRVPGQNIAGAGSFATELADIPHGVLHQHTFKSQVRGGLQEFFVYTPPGFRYSGITVYPLLFLLHGFGDDASTWSDRGKCGLILDKLISQNRARPMMVVMPSCYGIDNLQLQEKQWLQSSELRSRNIAIFGRILKNEIKPIVRDHYPVSDQGSDTAIAGVSMGATQALYLAAKTPEDYAWVGSFGGGGFPNGFENALPSTMNESSAHRKLLWLACATEDPGTAAHDLLCERLSRMNVEFISVQTPGRHDWSTWGYDLERFLQLIF